MMPERGCRFAACASYALAKSGSGVYGAAYAAAYAETVWPGRMTEF
jgi:hypothetical protein